MSLDSWIKGKKRGEILIGTSGWDYDEWVGPFYPDPRRKLQFYTRIFKTTEINSTFYSMPTPGLAKGLARATPPGFVFAAKLYKGITHEKKLDPKLGATELLEEYLNAIKPLKKAGKLGPILVQMPPKPPDYFPRFEDFLASLPQGWGFAVEFRDPAWLTQQTFSLLEKYRAAYVIVDEPLLPPIVKVTTDFAYIRWHGRGERPWYYYQYTEKELEEWVPKIKEAASQADIVYGYFNNHFRGYAPHNALQMLKLLGKADRTQIKVLEHIDSWFEVEEARKRWEAGLQKLRNNAPIEEVLAVLTTKGRLERGLQIPDDQVDVELKGNVVEGRIKNYTFRIDLEKREIIHNCADWEKTSQTKMLCKHLVKVFTKLPPEKAKEILEEIAQNPSQWKFMLL